MIESKSKIKFRDEIKGFLKNKLGLSNVMSIPHLKKIVLNMGVGKATQNSKIVNEAVETLTKITGQKAVVTRAKKAISNFKLREGSPIGAKVTLTGDRMWNFFDRLVHLALPRVRDFKGVSNKSFDGRGNYTLGIKEQIVFLEIEYDKIPSIMGMDISFVTSSDTDEGGRELLQQLGMPFRKK